VNRALRAATMGVLLLSPVALSACSAGQVTQTATQQRDKTGAQAQVGDISIREAKLAAPSGGGGYERGDDADLQVALVNGGSEADTLTAVDGKGFGSAEIANTASRISSSTSSTTPTDQIKIPAGSSVFVGQDNSDYAITFSDLDDPLNTGQYIRVTFTFEKAGDVTIPVTVANPPGSQERGKAYDFNKDRKATGEG
jgi:copper(I)-binding protein